MKVIKVPYGEGGLGKTLGSSDGPEAIVKELAETNLSESFRDQKENIVEVTIEPNSVGDNHQRIYDAVKETIGPAIILGGDHSITYSTVKGYMENNPGHGLIVFDAHPDLVSGTDLPSHEDYLWKLIEDGIVATDKVILIGIRNIHPIEKAYIDEKKIQCYTAKQIYDNGLENVCDMIMQKCKNWPGIYMSVDIDVLDPAFAPGTNHLEAGGISTRELLYFINRIKFLKSVRMADIVEIDPNIDVNGMTARVGARLVKDIFN